MSSQVNINVSPHRGEILSHRGEGVSIGARVCQIVEMLPTLWDELPEMTENELKVIKALSYDGVLVQEIFMQVDESQAKSVLMSKLSGLSQLHIKVLVDKARNHTFSEDLSL